MPSAPGMMADNLNMLQVVLQLVLV